MRFNFAIPSFTAMNQLRLSQRIDTRNPIFIVIDDDPGYHTVCKIILKKVFKKAEVHAFLDPTAGLNFIQEMSPDAYATRDIILFLDINMRGRDGFAVLNDLMDNSPSIMGYMYIYMLSSSIEPRDMIRSLNYSITSGYISKPLTVELLETFFLGAPVI